jgi:TonB-linked SusC/RagA family outer membrane protein
LANHSLRNQMASELYSVFTLSPLGIPYDDQGNIPLYAYPSEALGTNPLAEIKNNKDENRHSGFVGNAAFEWEIVNGLKYRFFSGVDYSTIRRGEYIGSDTYQRSGGPHQSNYSNWNTLSTIADNILSYKKTFDEKHRLDALGGFTTESYRNERVFLNGTDMDYEGLWYNLGAASTIIDKGTTLSEWSIMSFISRINYTFNDRYILTFTYRYDGSSRLAEENKWAGFPSAALGWRISEENFMKNADFLDNLKLRLSWGTTGNTNVSPYETLGRLGKTYYDWDGAPAIGYTPTQIPNPELKWEITTEQNIGLDFGFFNGRLSGDIDLYSRLTEDLMLRRNLPVTSGFTSITQNIGSVKNTGLELMLSSKIIDSRDFQWQLGITYAKNNNEIIDLYGDKKDDVGSEWFIGYPIRVDYRTEYLGVWQLGEEQEAAVYNAKPGYPKIRDIENEDADDPKITGLDRQIIPLDPEWTGGLNTTLKYKGFSLDFNLIISQGAKAYTRFMEIDDRFEARWNRIDIPYWTPDNPTNEAPMPTADITSKLNLDDSDFWLADLSYVRLSNINFGYRFPSSVTGAIGVKGLKTYINIKNPYVWSSFKGMDPETGVQINDHPTLTSYQFGLNINF